MPNTNPKKAVKIGKKTKFGKICAILWIGERYYMCLKKGVVSLMPAGVIEND